MIRRPTGKGRQKTVMDINDAIGKLSQKVWTQYLHIPCQDYHFDVLEQLELLLLLFRLGLWRDGSDMKGNAKGLWNVL